MKSRVCLAVGLCFLFLFSPVLSKGEQGQEDIRLLLSRAYVSDGQYEKAREACNAILREDPRNMQARVLLADISAYERKFEQAAALYAQILDEEGDTEVQRKLADVLSWDKQYDRAIALYDEILERGEDKRARVQKARILGWQRKYSDSLEEYRKALENSYDRGIDLEMRAKRAYWDGRVTRAIRNYDELIKEDNGNVEGMFDLSQLYSYQGMFREAEGRYEDILGISPRHFRAREGLEKAELLSRHVRLDSGYEFFEADSPSRSEDINRSSFFTYASAPCNYNLDVRAGYRLSYRKFSDFADVLENKAEVGFSYLRAPDWGVDAYYGVIAYNRGIDPLQVFGGSLRYRISDIVTSFTSFERKQLENTSQLIRDNYYADNYLQRFDFDINKRLKSQAEFLYSRYSDGNYKVEPGMEMLYLISLDPRRFSLRYKYFYRNFDEKKTEYFSPKGFSVNSLKANWRHFLNKEEIFFGANDLYYDLSYEFTVDSKNVIGNKFSAEFNWDISKRLNFNIRGSVEKSSSGVYKDKNITASMRYYF
ncbi:MAG: tetratricopeptide repeat protein [Candidatus Omnitrophica bacterium]|nr:tetratricopeptide repeat protein [Candidatus Omnitrophota bacterium]MDD5500667.1 tetratricopeptide repeat protein [Candidatus Omnitrophota bacterium]